MQADLTQPSSKPRRLVVIGTSGAGKSTMAKALARRLAIEHVELDALHWREGWIEAPDEEFLPLVEEATQGEGWVVDGNYLKAREIVWPKADTVVWLDYRFPRIFERLVRRTFRRCVRREHLWNGCVERCWPQLTSRDSILWWAITTYSQRRREYPPLLARPEYAHLEVKRFRTPRRAQAWLEGL